MREIKFRAWDKRFKNMDFGRGDLLLRINSKDFSEPMQFTNLKDKARKEIYEGDLIKNGLNTIFEVVYINYAWQLKFNMTKTGFSIISFEAYNHQHWTGPSISLDSSGKVNRPKHYDDYDIEIIGNIYENPELLKEK